MFVKYIQKKKKKMYIGFPLSTAKVGGFLPGPQGFLDKRSTDDRQTN